MFLRRSLVIRRHGSLPTPDVPASLRFGQTGPAPAPPEAHAIGRSLFCFEEAVPATSVGRTGVPRSSSSPAFEQRLVLPAHVPQPRDHVSVLGAAFENCIASTSVLKVCKLHSLLVTSTCHLLLPSHQRRTRSVRFQATKSQRWMPWRQMPMKVVGGCEKPRGAVYQALIRGSPNGETRLGSCPVTPA